MERSEIWSELSPEEQATVSNLSRVRMGMPVKGGEMRGEYRDSRWADQPSQPRRIRCAHCTQGHETVAQVRLCAERQRRRRADEHSNTVAEEGVDRCVCGCKYWENDRCIDCGTHVSAVREG